MGTLNSNKSNNVKIVGITNSQEITMEEFLNVLVNKGIIKSFSPIDFRFIGEYSYADNPIISYSPEKINLAGCYVSIYGRYCDNFTSTSNNLAVIIIVSPAVPSSAPVAKTSVTFLKPSEVLRAGLLYNKLA